MLFENIAGEIKTMAKVICGMGISASVIAGIVYIINGWSYKNSENFLLIGAVIAIAGSVLSYISSITLYGFGELIEKVSSIEENIPQIENIASAILSESRKIGASPNAEQK